MYNIPQKERNKTQKNKKPSICGGVRKGGRVFVGWKAEIPRSSVLTLVVYYKNLS